MAAFSSHLRETDADLPEKKAKWAAAPQTEVSRSLERNKMRDSEVVR